MPSAEECTFFQAALDLAGDLDQLHHFALGHRRTIVGSLPVLATDRAQEGDVLLGFDALRHHLLAELVGQGHDRAQNHRAGTVLAASLDEGAIDLHRVKGKLIEIGQRGKTGAEIVEREAGTAIGKLQPTRRWPVPDCPSPELLEFQVAANPWARQHGPADGAVLGQARDGKADGWQCSRWQIGVGPGVATPFANGQRRAALTSTQTSRDQQ